MNSFIYVLVSGTLFYSFAVTLQPATNVQKNAIEKVIHQFAKAGADRNISVLEEVLNDQYRVVAHRFMGKSEPTIIPKAAYIQMMKEEKIGGNKVKVVIHQVEIHDHSAMAQVDFVAEKSTMKLFLNLILFENDQWQIISDMAVMKGH